MRKSAPVPKRVLRNGNVVAIAGILKKNAKCSRLVSDNMNHARSFIFLIMLLFLSCSTSAVTGRLVDSAGAPVAGAAVTVISRENIDGGSTRSNSDGEFTVALFGSRNEITIEAKGYGEVRMELPATPFQVVLKPATAAHMQSLEGIGATLEDRGQAIVVAEIEKCGPAATAGVTVGLELVAVDGVAVHIDDTSGAARAIRGAAGTSVTLTLREPGSGALRMTTIKRQALELPCP